MDNEIKEYNIKEMDDIEFSFGCIFEINDVLLEFIKERKLIVNEKLIDYVSVIDNIIDINPEVKYLIITTASIDSLNYVVVRNYILENETIDEDEFIYRLIKGD